MDRYSVCYGESTAAGSQYRCSICGDLVPGGSQVGEDSHLCNRCQVRRCQRMAGLIPIAEVERMLDGLAQEIARLRAELRRSDD